ncbi:MAG: hypothetical protein V3R89_01580 [Thermoanaerobaculia bacterium]
MTEPVYLEKAPKKRSKKRRRQRRPPEGTAERLGLDGATNTIEVLDTGDSDQIKVTVK